MTDLIEPIIVDENGDVTVFASLRDAEMYVEPVDIANGEYRFYDATGLVLSGEAHTKHPPHGPVRRLLPAPSQHVRILASTPTDRRPDELAEVLRSFLARLGDRIRIEDGRLEHMTLDELVAATADLHLR